MVQTLTRAHSFVLRAGRLKNSAAMRSAFPAMQMVVDSIAWTFAVVLAIVLRYEGDWLRANLAGAAVLAVAAVALQLLFGKLLGLYRRRYHYGSFDELLVVGLTTVSVSTVTFLVALLSGGALVPRTVPVIAGFLHVVFASAARYIARLLEDLEGRRQLGDAERTVVYGAGEAGIQIVRMMLRAGHNGVHLPVAYVDDDPRKARLHVNGLVVEGTGEDTIAVAERYGATKVLVAIPSITGDRLRDITTPLIDSGLEILVLPPVHEMLGNVDPSDIRPLTIADLLGRRPIDIDLSSIAQYITGHRVLVTGAGGSIGSELCRQLAAFGPEELAMLDRDESGLHSTQLTLDGRALLDSPSLVVADIRDTERLVEVFTEHRPEVVFHAAALKHLTLLEMHPTEAWKTNVVGTQNVLDAARATGVQVLVNISTDKAADPTSVLGHSKRTAERLTAEAARTTGLRYVSVRFGNVLGSRGSVLTTFRRQVEQGGPITVTHPDVTRYFMMVEEAVALTIQAGALGDPGEVLVLDMGNPVRIADVAERLAAESTRPIRIEFTGLRPGEKMHEALLGSGEEDVRPKHPLISQVPVPPLTFDDAADMCAEHLSLRGVAWGARAQTT